jgi:hypothetical protein
MGLQRETAGRGTLAIYSSVGFLSSYYRKCFVTFTTDSLRRCFRIYRFPYHAFSSLDHWNDDHRELSYIYHRNLNSFSFTTLCSHPRS